ncbi:hypothetical protein C2845_PM10G09500 [Panicum miliaceum]|uniref:Uncharacterized protein n=1 Tax=Panicum miliaceum TaxID=4540 RepID=A0A3L6PFM8_PANMI|nr:hypothetical protein C2845_PM10G09500 [Panicum miliaceum]
MGSSTRDRLQHHWVEEEEEREIFRVDMAEVRETARERMGFWAKRGEAAKKHGYNPTPPPMEILRPPRSFPESMGMGYHISMGSGKSFVPIQEIPPGLLQAQPK